MFWKRALTVVVGLPTLLYILIVLPPQVVFVLFWVSSMVVTFEFSRMFYLPLVEKFCEKREKPHQYSRFFVVVLCALYFFLVTQLGFPVVSLLLLLIFLDIFIHFSIKSSPEFLVAHVLFSFVAIGYCCLPWILLWDIYEKASGAKLLLLLLVIVMASDMGAYAIGSRFGKHKFAPLLSPKKTWEGFLGGLASGVLGALLYNYFAEALPGHWILVVLCSLGCSVMAAIGDLVESSFKRFSRVKDSGNILPGHGGLLDRVDAIVFTVPFFHFIIYWL
jgi:phosphatidate cytidylyltransferase